MAATSVSGQTNTTGNPFSPDDDYMSAYQKSIKVAQDSQSIVKVSTSGAVTEKLTELKITETIIKKPIIKKEVFSEEDYLMMGTAIHSEGKTIGMKFQSTLRNKKYLLFKTIKKDVALDGGNRISDYYTGTYLIPTDWWNINITGNNPTWDQLQFIIENFKVD